MLDYPDAFHRITVQRARVLAELAEGWTARQASDRLGVTYNGVRSHLANIKSFTGCRTVGELARWWRANRVPWALFMLEAAGISPDQLMRQDHDFGTR